MAVTFVQKLSVNKIITRLGRSVTYTPITKTTDNATGDETFTAGTPVVYTAVFLKKSVSWTYDKLGLFNDADAYVIFNPTDLTPTKNSTIDVDGETLRIQSIATRYGDNANSVAIYHFCALFRYT